MGQGRQITGSSQGTLLRNHWRDAFIKHFNEHLYQYGPYAADAYTQGIGPQEHHAPHLLFPVGLPGSGAMT